MLFAVTLFVATALELMVAVNTELLKLAPLPGAVNVTVPLLPTGSELTLVVTVTASAVLKAVPTVVV